MNTKKFEELIQDVEELTLKITTNYYNGLIVYVDISSRKKGEKSFKYTTLRSLIGEYKFKGVPLNLYNWLKNRGHDLEENRIYHNQSIDIETLRSLLETLDEHRTNPKYFPYKKDKVKQLRRDFYDWLDRFVEIFPNIEYEKQRFISIKTLKYNVYVEINPMYVSVRNSKGFQYHKNKDLNLENLIKIFINRGLFYRLVLGKREKKYFEKLREELIKPIDKWDLEKIEDLNLSYLNGYDNSKNTIDKSFFRSASRSLESMGFFDI